MCGYLEEKSSQNKVIFKIRDKKSEKVSPKKTKKSINKDNDEGKRTQIKTGSICNNDGMKNLLLLDLFKMQINNMKKIMSSKSD